MRAFVAIEIPADIKRALADLQARLKSVGVEASWTRPEGIHLTLKFLGEIPEDSVNNVMNSVVQAVEGRNSFHLTISGAGVFPHEKNPRVVWVGVAGDLDQLMGIRICLEEQMVRLGFQQEDRRFTPHLTLGRIKHLPLRGSWMQAREAIKNITLPGFDVAAISLVKSELNQTGAVYTEIGKAGLG